MKIASWNVNTLKVRLPHLAQWCGQQGPDILALQETKLDDPAFPLALYTTGGCHLCEQAATLLSEAQTVFCFGLRSAFPAAYMLDYIRDLIGSGSVLADASSEEHNTPSAAARAAIDTPAGSYYLPLNQPWAALAVAALEPEAPGGFQASGLLGGAARSARVMAAPTLVFEEPD